LDLFKEIWRYGIIRWYKQQTDLRTNVAVYRGLPGQQQHEEAEYENDLTQGVPRASWTIAQHEEVVIENGAVINVTQLQSLIIVGWKDKTAKRSFLWMTGSNTPIPCSKKRLTTSKN
jgi:hypothetical protein